MKNLTVLAGNAVAFITLLSLFTHCQKLKEELVIDAFKITVTNTSPYHQKTNSRYDENVTATLNTPLDTNKLSIKLMIVKIDTIANQLRKLNATGVTIVSNYVVSFVPEDELLPSSVYEATLSISRKEDSATPIHNYNWTFTTKDADAYQMSLRSNHVTDFERDGNRCMQIGKYLYSFGGWHVPEESFNDVYRSRGDLSQWEKMPDAPWHGRHEHGIVNVNGYTYVVGGDYLQPRFDVWRTADGENWTLLADNILNNRILYGCAEHNGYIYIVGGAGYNDVWRSRDGANWELVTNYVPFLKGVSFAGSLISFRGKLWMICGGTDGYGNGEILKDVWSSTDGKIWKQEKDFTGSKRYYNDMLVWDNKLWVVGGFNHEEGNTKSIWYMKPNGNWVEFETPDNYVGRHASGLAIFNNQLAIVCGNYQNNCWVIEKIQ